MSKFRCRCGFLMIFQTGIEPYDLELIPESSIDDIIEMIDENKTINPEEFLDKLGFNSLSVMRCPQCDRIWLEDDNHKGVYNSYLREKD